MDKRIGAQFFTIKDFCKTLEDFDASCKKVKDIGYKVVQLSGIGDFSAEEVKEIIDKYDLTVACTHRPAAKYTEHIEEEIAFHKLLDCDVCGLGSMPQFNAKPESLEEFIRDFKPVCKRLGEEGLVFAYHNHAFDFSKIDGKFAFDILAEGLDADNFKLILDVYWLAVAGLNPAKYIRENKGRIACVHFKDLQVVENSHGFGDVGEGNLDWDEIIEACNEADVKYALVERDKCDGDPFDSLRNSYEYLKTKGFC